MLDINKTSQKGLKLLVISTLIVFVLSRIYQLFAHGVSSNYLTYAFLIPLILGLVFYLFLPIKAISITRFSYNCLNAGILTLTLGSFLKGVFEIASSSSDLLIIYLILGLSLLAIGSLNILIKGKG